MPVAPSLTFSIVTPSHRQLSWLKLCAASVGDQEGVTVEHIIQDAQSGPDLEEWVKKNTKARLHVERDEGMYDAINRGLRRAQGEICAYLNCDEQYLPGTLRRVEDYFARHPETDVVFGDAILTDSAGEPVGYRSVVKPRRWHTLLRPLNVLTCGIFFRRRVVEEGALFDTAWKITGDKAWILDLLKRRYWMGVLPEPLAVFALTGSNLSLHQDVHAERRRWKAEVPRPVRWAKPLVRAGHILEKWKRGGYRGHRIDSEWYTQASFPARRRFAGLTLDWKWPSLSQSGTS